jgi:ribosomal-protein-alanine N-acetyltransferase
VSERVHLETRRLVLRLAEPSEARLVVDYLERNREHLARWEPDAPIGFYTESYWRERVVQIQREEEEGRVVRVHLFDKAAVRPRRVIGTIGLSNIVRGAFHNAHLGFGLDGSVQGEGYMREALEALIAYAFGPLNLHRLEANHQPHNLRSAALLRRLGFQPTGFARDYLHIDGAWRDHVQTALVNPEWKKPSW